jgi:hypothetical protein
MTALDAVGEPGFAAGWLAFAKPIAMKRSATAARRAVAMGLCVRMRGV